MLRICGFRTAGIAAALLALASCKDTASPQDDRTIRIRNGNVTLAGTLDLPSTPGPHPVMVFIPGSGRTTREDDRAALDIALPRGVAVFRYDKRGLGESTGVFEEVTTENSARVLADRASDVRAIVDWLATRPGIRADKILLWGTSQGAWVAPLVAALTSRVAFVICVNGGGSPVGTVIEYERLGRNASVPIDELIRQASAFSGPYGYDPLPTLASLHTDVLWIFGGQDRNTPSQLDIARLEQLQNSAFTIKLFPRMNHDMIDVDTGAFPATLFPEVYAWAGPRIAGS
jgi:pimeloyl-ACP methyl ester carboxylesterase